MNATAETPKLAQPITAEWEITRAKNAGSKSNPHGGTLVKWYCGFKRVDGAHDFPDVYWQRKEGSEVKVGDKVYGTIEEGQYGLRFKKEQAQHAPPNSGSGRSGGWQPESQFDPEKVARIGRAHAQGAALDFLTLAGFEVDPEDRVVALEQTVKPIIDWFQADVDAAAKAAREAAQAPADEKQSDAEYLHHLLTQAGFVTFAAGVVQRYIESEFTDDQRASAEKALGDPESVQWARQKLTAGAEKWNGAPLPGETSDEDIPF